MIGSHEGVGLEHFAVSVGNSAVETSSRVLKVNKEHHNHKLRNVLEKLNEKVHASLLAQRVPLSLLAKLRGRVVPALYSQVGKRACVWVANRVKLFLLSAHSTLLNANKH